MYPIKHIKILLIVFLVLIAGFVITIYNKQKFNSYNKMPLCESYPVKLNKRQYLKDSALDNLKMRININRLSEYTFTGNIDTPSGCTLFTTTISNLLNDKSYSDVNSLVIESGNDANTWTEVITLNFDIRASITNLEKPVYNLENVFQLFTDSIKVKKINNRYQVLIPAILELSDKSGGYTLAPYKGTMPLKQIEVFFDQKGDVINVAVL